MNNLKQSMLTLLGRAVPAAVGLGSVAIYTRLLDPASVGSYVLLLGASLLATSIGFAWLRNAVLRVVPGEPEGRLRPNVAATIVLSYVATAATMGLLEAVALHVLRPGLPTTSLWLAVGAAVAIGWYDLNQSLMQAQLRFVAWGALNLARAVVALVASVAFIRLGMKTDALLGGFICGNCATLLFVGAWFPALRGRFDRTLIARLLNFGWPLSLKAGLEQIAPTAQRYVFDYFIGTKAVGLYAVANDVTGQTLGSIVGAMSLGGIPRAFAARDRGGDAALRAQLLANAELLFAIALPLTFGLAALAKPIAGVLFGPNFRTGAEPVIALIAMSALCANLRVYYFDQAFELALDTRPQPVVQFVGTLVMLVASVALIPHYAAVGASAASLIANVVALGGSVLWGRHFVRTPIPTSSWWKTAIATTSMTLVLWFVPKRGGVVDLIELGILGAVAYAVVSIALRYDLIRARLSPRLASQAR